MLSSLATSSSMRTGWRWKLLASIPSEMVASLANKPTAKDAWDSNVVTRVGLDHARKATV
jgi:hypothetical protein